MPKNELHAMQFKAMKTTDLTDAVQLQQRILEFVHINAASNNPSKLATLNRRFGKVAKANGTTTIDVVQDLMAVGLLIPLATGAQTIVTSAKVHKVIEDHAPSATELQVIVARIMSQAI